MNRLKVCLVAILCAAGLVAGARADAYANEYGVMAAQDEDYGIRSDVFPPTVQVVSPERDEVVTTGTPLVEIAFEDPGSGIDETTIYLALDRADVTSRATVEEDRITYRPAVALARGTHEVYFGVRDRAGNLAEVRWTFEVKPVFEGMQTGGRNTLKIEWYPISKITDTLDFTVGARVAETDVRLRVLGRGTDHPAGSPLVSYGEYNLYLDKYSLEVRHDTTILAAGYATIPIESEILQVSREARGFVGSTILRGAAGQHNVSAFSGRLATSSGLALQVYNLTGVTEQWRAKSGLVLSGILAKLDAEGGYDYCVLGARGTARVLGRASLRFEAVHGVVSLEGGTEGDEAQSGNALALHLDVPLGAGAVGLDFVTLQPAYPLPGAPPSLSPERGGVVRYGLRTMARMPAKGVLTVNGVLTRDNLDGSEAYTLDRGNVSASYHYPLTPALSLRANYQGEYKRSDDAPDPAVDAVAGTASITASMQLGQAPRRSSVSATYSAGASEDRVLGKASNTAKVSGTWSMTLGGWTLSSRLDASRQEVAPDATRTDATTARLTATGQVVPKLLQGTFSLFRTGSDRFEGGAVVPALRKTEAGLETNLRLSVTKSSTLALVFKNSWWTQQDTSYEDGQNRALNLEWTVSF